MRTITTSTAHELKPGDHVQLFVPDRRWWRRLWCWLTWQPLPTRAVTIRIHAIQPTNFSSKDWP